MVAIVPTIRSSSMLSGKQMFGRAIDGADCTAFQHSEDVAEEKPAGKTKKSRKSGKE
jgi:hypothetical protein